MILINMRFRDTDSNDLVVITNNTQPGSPPWIIQHTCNGVDWWYGADDRDWAMSATFALLRGEDIRLYPIWPLDEAAPVE